MCEPTHSIVQFPNNDDQGNSTEPRVRSKLGKIAEWGKKIRDWFHFSTMGAGHSANLELVGAQEILLPSSTQYEALWWNRTVHIDGRYRGKEFDKEIAGNAAHSYAKEVSIGNLTKLRMFLETSMRKSERPGMYINAFLTQMLPA